MNRAINAANAIVVGAMMGAAAPEAFADEGGVSFWAPGQFGSFAAVPSEPGWSLPVVYYHTSVSAGAEEAFHRGGRIVTGIKADADLVFALPTYTFASPVAGGQAAVSLGGAVGHMKASIDATLTGPQGAVVSGSESDTLNGVADLYPLATLKWKDGANNFLAYAMGGIPVGSYEVGRLANLGTSHWSLDAGGGYTYFDPEKGHEFSAVVGFTYSWANKDTQYKNGISSHLDWAASQFLSPQTHVGVAGYVYYQLTGDSGAGATLGDFKSRVAGLGPQVGYFFPVGKDKWYVNLKGYYEFDARNRPEGWNVWLALAIPL
jgi:hypothetical protein